MSECVSSLLKGRFWAERSSQSEEGRNTESLQDKMGIWGEKGLEVAFCFFVLRMRWSVSSMERATSADIKRNLFDLS